MSRHGTVGRKFRSGGAVYLCTSWNRQRGFCMEMVAGESKLFPDRVPGHRTDVSERAIGRTYHRAYDDESYLTRHDDGCNCRVCEEREPSR